MNIGDEIKILLSCGLIEEGIIVNDSFIFDDSKWLVISHKENSNKILNIRYKDITAFQVEPKEQLKQEVKTLIVDDFSEREIVKNHIVNVSKEAINKIYYDKQIFKKLINKAISNENKINYNIPSFIKK